MKDRGVGILCGWRRWSLHPQRGYGFKPGVSPSPRLREDKWRNAVKPTPGQPHKKNSQPQRGCVRAWKFKGYLMLKSLSRILIHTVYSTKDRLFSSAIQNFGTGNTSGIDSARTQPRWGWDIGGRSSRGRLRSTAPTPGLKYVAPLELKVSAHHFHSSWVLRLSIF